MSVIVEVMRLELSVGASRVKRVVSASARLRILENGEAGRSTGLEMRLNVTECYRC